MSKRKNLWHLLAFMVAGAFMSAPSAWADKMEGAEEKQAVETSKVSLNVTNIQSSVGRIYVSVYDSKDTFLSETKVYAENFGLENLQDGSLVIELSLPQGRYAIAVHHDDNANGEMDSNFIGIPKEPVGFSNGHVPRFGPPKFAKAAIDITSAEVEEKVTLID
ncbi:DUF2141 domain-containing protein [Biformimicrobium ophioploci]|uniref:DUF2141 domain-containing protein n=1 Tax=Biformimicrobium ophioploci TaxID=3036711 RepID=A0ABQ6LW86_9GAMM|nr:DUF2141 domain-containing protein [Microbulbifer sp. NKW57]GMG86315.1 hypothetical protein MNKW57_06360 [Microbulbifer sp. NKW57]